MADAESLPAAGDQTQSRSLLAQHWKRNLGIVAGFAVVLMVVLFAVFGDSDVSRLALEAAKNNPVVQQRLGEPIKRGFFTSGSIEISDSSGHADLSIPVSGPKGSAKIYAVAQKKAGIWQFEILEVAFDETSPRTSLVKEGTGLPTQ